MEHTSARDRVSHVCARTVIAESSSSCHDWRVVRAASAASADSCFVGDGCGSSRLPLEGTSSGGVCDDDMTAAEVELLSLLAIEA